MSVNRRHFLTRSGLLAMAGVGGPAIGRAANAPLRSGERPKRIVHMVADGMSMGTLTCSDYYSQLTRKRGLTWVALQQQPGVVNAWMNMRSLNSMVTDSSAASSSWGSGSRIVNGQVNLLPDGRELKPLYELFGTMGWKRGLVTTTEITHATPAGFAASGLKREAAEDVAVQYLERRIDVLLGGGQKYFDSSKRKDRRDLLADFKAAGYAVMTQADLLGAASKEKRWLGVFHPGHLPFTLDHTEDSKLKRTVPSIAAMTSAALRRLEREEHFILQVEGGRVDHGAHACDAAATFRDLVAFDEAVDVVMEFQRRHPHTLVVITTDHGNGNPGSNGAGKAYGDSSSLFRNLTLARRSFEAMEPLLSKAKSPAEVRGIILDSRGYKTPDDKLEMILPFIEKKGKCLYDLVNSLEYQLGQLMANHVGIGWASGSHTADFVPLTARGPGAEKFVGFLPNTDVFRHYLDLAEIDFRNPQLPLMAECGPSADHAEQPCEAFA